jgi:hypothetical protein
VVSRSYYMLIASLPNLPPHFDVEQIPIKRPLLVERLRMLHPADARVINQVIAFLAWDRQPLDRTDQEVFATYRRLMATISNALLREVIEIRMNYRTIIAALRRRRVGQSAPPGVGPWVDQIRRNFQHPTFQLHGRYPWIEPLDRLLAEADPMRAQHLLFDVSYRQWSRRAEQFTFCFEALILYLVRWDIIERWTSRDAEVGRQRFEKLITETLGDYAHLF